MRHGQGHRKGFASNGHGVLSCFYTYEVYTLHTNSSNHKVHFVPQHFFTIVSVIVRTVREAKSLLPRD